MSESDQDLADALEIKDRGWRQGSVLDPFSAEVSTSIQANLTQDEFLVVYTQSCTVVSRRFSVDPEIELIVAKPINKFKERSPEATGKHQRKLHIAYVGQDGGIECDFNRRITIDRRLLTKCAPVNHMSIGESGALKLGAWIGRAYTRIALPDQLVENMRKKNGLIELLKKALDTPYGPEADPVHFEVPFIYINWQPRDDDANVFALSFQFICTEHGAAEVLDEALIGALQKYNGLTEIDGIKVEQWECKPASETFLTDLDGYERLSEWDYLSNLADVIDIRG